MGFRIRRSLQIMPGVRFTASKSGLGISVGPRGAHLSVNTSGRVTTSAGIPGTGLSFVKSRTIRKKSTVSITSDATPLGRPVEQTAPDVAGPSKIEQELLACATGTGSIQTLRQLQQADGSYSLTARYVELLKFAIPEGLQQRIDVIFTELADAGYRPSMDHFMTEYMSASTVNVAIARGFRATMSLAEDLTFQLCLIENVQARDSDRALEIAEKLEPSTVAAASLAELYALKSDWEEIVMLASGATDDDDAGRFLSIQKAIALRELGRTDEANDVFAHLVLAGNLSRELRVYAMEEWGKTPKPTSKKLLRGTKKVIALLSPFTIVEKVAALATGVSICVGYLIWANFCAAFLIIAIGSRVVLSLRSVRNDSSESEN